MNDDSGTKTKTDSNKEVTGQPEQAPNKQGRAAISEKSCDARMVERGR